MTRPLAERLDTLPLILCGPILRRTQPDSVTVWLALRKPRKVTLEVFAADPAGEWIRPARQSGVAQSVAIGDNLHIVAVTTTGQALAWGDLYGYDLNFEPAPGAAADTAGVGRLFAGAASGRTGVYAAKEEDARAALTYRHIDGKAPDLPSFVLPPDAARTKGTNPLNHLRVCHGSCRKAHGESFDGLAGLDLIVAKALTPGALEPRPHMLLLTGDQIYADDVADALLALLIDAGGALLGWSETLPGKGATPGPGRRAAFGESLGLTAMLGKPEYGKSHLLHFAEYAAMYLFAWSDVLWPHEETYPGLEVYRDGIQNSHEGNLFYDDLDRLKQFRSTLPQVRRALANVPVYMIFDDHEITDDWYLNLRWVSGVLERNNPAGRRVIMNGLLAYAIFQAWGNTPWLFKEGDAQAPGRRLLDAAARWRGKVDQDETEIIGRLNIPTYDGRKRVPGDAPAPIMRWHHTVQTPNFLCLLLDTRTMRGFPGDLLDPPELLNDQGFALQIDQAPEPPQDGVTVVVATTNVFSEPLTEFGVDLIGAINLHKRELAVFDPDRGDAWTPQSQAYERLLARLADRAPDTGEPRRKARVVIATGDIHYGFATRAQYWGESPYRAPPDKARSPKPVDAVFAQFTASSFRNEAGKTRILHERAFLTVKDKQLLGELMSGSWIGWREPPGITEALALPEIPMGLESPLRSLVRDRRAKEMIHNLRSTPATMRVDGLSMLSFVRKAPDWRYRVDYIKDGSVSLLQGIRLTDNPKASPEERAAQVEALADAHRDYAQKSAGRIVVGRNNIGELRFRWGAGENKTAIQKLWWRMTDDAEPAALTDYQISLGFNEARFPKPGYPGE